MHCGWIETLCITCRKLITTIELQYYVNLRANFNLNKFENLSIRSDRQHIISIQSFFNVMGWKRPSNHFQSSECFIYIKSWFFCLIHKVDFCVANMNLRVSKWFTTYPVNFRKYLVINTRDNIQMFGALCSSWFSMKQCSNDCNQMLGGKRVRQENRLPHIINVFKKIISKSTVGGSFVFFLVRYC